jgi:hypothetical protein
MPCCSGNCQSSLSTQHTHPPPKIDYASFMPLPNPPYPSITYPSLFPPLLFLLHLTLLALLFPRALSFCFKLFSFFLALLFLDCAALARFSREQG